MSGTQISSGGEERLRSEEVAWLTTVRADGQPQSVPVWFLWDGEKALIYSQPAQQKLRNIRRNPRVGFNLNSDAYGSSVLRAEGTAEMAEDVAAADEIPAYLEKYREGISRIGFSPQEFARAFSVPFHVKPERWQEW